MMSPFTRKPVKRTAWMGGLFYFLIALEFIYMASPFAVYFLAGYIPGLESLDASPWTAWLTRFFLPHFAETSSALVDSAPVIGAALTIAGLSGFVVGASQVYARKLLKKGAATGGIYKFIRHPQYASLIVAGAGMLLLWPRFLMVGVFVLMLFAYKTLAWIEEQECVRRFGQAYIEYQQRTPRFFPFHGPFGCAASRVQSKPLRLASGILACTTALAVAFGIAFGIRDCAIDSLFSRTSGDTVHVALSAVDDLEQVIQTAMTDERVRTPLAAARDDRERLISYTMPWEWFVPELSMNGAENHRAPRDFKRRRYKVVYTRAVLPEASDAQGLDILRQAVRTEPLVEAWIDEKGQVARVSEVPEETRYRNLPVPVF